MATNFRTIQLIHQSEVCVIGECESGVLVSLRQWVQFGIRTRSNEARKYCRPSRAYEVLRRGEQRRIVQKYGRRTRLWVEIFHSMIEIGIFRPLPPRFMALVGVVGTLMIGSFGAMSAGCKPVCPRGTAS